MSDRPTPDTDSARKYCTGKWADYMRITSEVIERERDEARDQAHEAIASWVEILALARELRDALQELHDGVEEMDCGGFSVELEQSSAALTKANKLLP